MIETLRHQEAFEYYYSLGEARTLPQVSQKSKAALVTVKRWSKAFNWQERVQERDNKNAKALAKKTDNLIVRDKTKDLKLVEAAKAVWLQQLKGSIKAKCPECQHEYNIHIPKLKAQFRDLDTFIRLSEFLAGEADSRPEQIIRLEYVDPKPRTRRSENEN